MLTTRLGIQSWCFRSCKETGQVIESLKRCGVDRIELCGIHIDLAHARETLKQYADNGIRISSFEMPNTLTGAERFSISGPSRRPAQSFRRDEQSHCRRQQSSQLQSCVQPRFPV